VCLRINKANEKIMPFLPTFKFNIKEMTRDMSLMYHMAK
jgi:hypothetical protein